MLLAGAAFHKLPSAVVLVVGETVSRFAWPQYVVGAVLYTLIVFAGQFSREERLGPRVFSSQNAKPLPAILAVHILFLLAFLGCMWMASSRLAQMPVWMTAKDLFNLSRHGGEKVSLIELLLAVAAWVLRTIELPCVYGKSKTSGPVTFERP